MQTQSVRRGACAPRKPPRGSSYYLTERDKRMLQYIWKWKIASTASIHEAVNRTQSPYSTYKILEKLEKNRFVECRFEFAERFYVWQLTEFGFRTMITNNLSELKEDGYLSENHRHDRLVQAFQLGEWATYQFPEVLFCTEQELRRQEVEKYPDWVPKTTEHRPDGYMRIVLGKKHWTYAYEVELTAKNVQRYESALSFYKHSRLVDRVFWLVSSPFVKEQILRAKDCIKDESANFHVFVELDDYEKNGWDAVITNERSQRLGTVRSNFQDICGDPYREILGKPQGVSKVMVHLEPRKVIGKSRS